jgi:Glycosyl transferase family 2/Alpha 1,4-glycosyltransferase conserved region
MHLAAVTTVRSECDVIESFVRHNAAFFDRLYILDHRSVDATTDILRKLADEGLPLVLSREDYGIFYQGPTMTHLIKRAFDDHPWDFIIPLDSDEFLRIADRATLEAVLADLDGATIGLTDIINYIPLENDNWNEMDVLRRIAHRTKTIPDIKCKIGKVVIPGAVIKHPRFSVNEGQHGVCINGTRLPERRLDGLSLGHFPVRSINQFTLRSVLYRLAWASRFDYNPSWGWHYKSFFEQLETKPTVSPDDLTKAALLYVDIYLQPGEAPHQKVLAYEPVIPSYHQLRFTDLVDVAVLPPILDMMDFLLDELRAARMASPTRMVFSTPESESSDVVVNRTQQRTVPNSKQRVHHRFQSFWYGEALSPYELFCLKSFIDNGHAVDLYTYDANLVAPEGVRICNAAELIPQDEVFVYQPEGFGKGSPSAFSNVFRYKLLIEKGGWWIDTDVVCLTDRVPVVNEFFARQDADLVACGTMYFEPHHPVMVQCLDQAVKLGRTVKWGDTGPRLLTRVLQECGALDRAVPALVCYPIHYNQALDMLRPSRTAVLAPRVESSLFLHVWNSMLVHRGVQKACRPPKGSLLRRFTDEHPVDGWIGEYDESTLEHGVNLKAELDACAEEKSQLRTAYAEEKSQLQAAYAEEKSQLQAAYAEEKSQLQAAAQLQIAGAELLKVECNAQAKERARLQAALELQVAGNERLQAQLHGILNSLSWRLTAPLRAGRRRFPMVRFLRRL